MPNPDLIPDNTIKPAPRDKTNTDFNKNEVNPSEISIEFRILAGHLENLYSDQGYLSVLSKQAAGKILPVSNSFSSGQPIKDISHDAQIYSAPSAQDLMAKELTDLNPSIEFVPFDEHPDSRWERTLRLSEGMTLPAPQNRCNSSHWQILQSAAATIEDALLSLSRHQGFEPVGNYLPVAPPEEGTTDLESELDRRVAEASRLIAQSKQQTKDEEDIEAGGLYLVQLQRELQSLVRLVRCTASLCTIFGDFNAANINAGDASEPGSFPFARAARAIASVSKSLGKRADAIEASSDFLLDYIEAHPEIALKAAEIEEVSRFRRKMREDAADESKERFTPREIGKFFLRRTDDTARKIIAEMESNPSERHHLKGSNGRYTREQAKQLLRYYMYRPGRWKT